MCPACHPAVTLANHPPPACTHYPTYLDRMQGGETHGLAACDEVLVANRLWSASFSCSRVGIMHAMQEVKTLLHGQDISQEWCMTVSGCKIVVGIITIWNSHVIDCNVWCVESNRNAMA